MAYRGYLKSQKQVYTIENEKKPKAVNERKEKIAWWNKQGSRRIRRVNDSKS